MDYRIGNCSACGAVYKVPASFAHDTAKCKQCAGAVQIGPVEKAAKAAPQKAAETPVPPKAAPNKPAASAAPKAPPVPASRPEAKKKRSGPSMKEQLLARKQAEAEAPARSKAPAAKPKAAVQAASLEPEEAAADSKSGSRGRSGGRSSSRGSRSSGSRSSGGRSSGGRGSRRGAPAAKKKSPMPALLGIGGLVLVGGGAAFMFREDLGLAEPAESTEVLAAEAPATGAASDARTTPAESPAQPVADTPSEAEAAPEAAPAASSDDATEDPPKDEVKKDETKQDDPAEVAANDPNDPILDLSTMPEFGPATGTPAEEWKQLSEWGKTFLDLDAGAAQGRAGRWLVEASRKGFPVLLNSARSVDLLTPQGRELGGLIQKALSDICNGINYGWRYNDESVKAAKFNAKVLRKWATEWGNADKDVEYWIRMAKLDDKDPELAKALREELGKTDSSGGLDDELLDDDLLDDF